MKIIIIGGGIGGLSTYVALRKDLPSATIAIYEAYSSSRSTTSIIGAGLGLQPNGQRAIDAISPHALEYIQANGRHARTFTFRNERGKTLGVMNTGEPEKHGYATVMAPRAVVHEAFLRVKVQNEEVEKVVQWGKRVKDVEEHEEYVEVEFEDGQKDTCDLLIGADGVKSVVKEAILGKGYPANYDGLTGIGGFIPVSALPKTFTDTLEETPVTMTFSRSGFFGISICTPATSASGRPEQIMWWSTFASDPPLPKDTPPAEIQQNLLKRHGDWVHPSGEKVFADIINLGLSIEQDEATWNSGFLILQRLITPPLPRWSSVAGGKGGRVVLIGDAAHTMPPDSGQGVSCAVEDGLAVALLLKEYLKLSGTPEMEALRKMAVAYEDIRKPRVTKILQFAKKQGDGKREMGWFGEKMRDFGLAVFTRLPSWVVHDGLYGYDVEEEVTRYLGQGKK